MKKGSLILFIYALISFTPVFSYSQEKLLHLHFAFLDDTIDVATDSTLVVNYTSPVSTVSIQAFYDAANASKYQPVIDTLLAYKKRNNLSDWLYYQLIRHTAQQIAPKAENYARYTLYKWFFLAKSGYDATLGIGNNEILFYVYSNENIYDIPLYEKDGRQYVCLNYHDYGKIDFDKDTIKEIAVTVPEGQKAFSYKVTSMPDFRPTDYAEKDLQFSYHKKVYRFKVLMNPQVQTIFANYPIVDFESYFNIPLTKETYSSLIPKLKQNISGLSCIEGVDYLMRFTRYAFMYENDQDNFGKEKRLSPEQTLLNQYSDCDDRAALFYYLVKEIYNLPMIAMLYPTHITIAVKFDKPVGEPVIYNGSEYYVCDPTAQRKDLAIGEIPANLKNAAYQVVFAYNPQGK